MKLNRVYTVFMPQVQHEERGEMCEERLLLTTILLASCCEFTTLEQDDQDDQGADNLEFMNRVGQHTFTTSLQHNQNWRTKTMVGWFLAKYFHFAQFTFIHIL